MPEDKDGHDEDEDGDGEGEGDGDGNDDAHVRKELVDPVTRRVGHAAWSFSPSKLEPLRDLPLRVD